MEKFSFRRFMIIFIRLSTVVVGITTAVIQVQYQRIIETDNARVKEAKRKLLITSFIIFCILAFMSIVSFVFPPSNISFHPTPSFDTTYFNNPDSTQDTKIFIDNILLENGMTTPPQKTHSEPQDIAIVDNDGKQSFVTVTRACCDKDSETPVTSVIYSQPEGYEYVYLTNPHYDRFFRWEKGYKNPFLKFIDFNEDGIWLHAIMIAGTDDNGIAIPFLKKDDDNRNYYVYNNDIYRSGFQGREFHKVPIIDVDSHVTLSFIDPTTSTLSERDKNRAIHWHRKYLELIRQLDIRRLRQLFL